MKKQSKTIDVKKKKLIQMIQGIKQEELIDRILDLVSYLYIHRAS